MNFVSAKEARDFYHVTSTTLWKWKKEGRIVAKQLTPRKVLYDIDSMGDMISDNKRKNVIYGRVSTYSQKNDLNNQIETVKSYMLANGVICDEIYKDIASGINENRKGLQDLICAVARNEIDTVYITFKDRLTRFGFGYLEYLFSIYNTKIVVLDKNEETNNNFQTELTNDLISIIHHFSMKLYSNRRNKLKDIEKILTSDNEAD